MGKQYSSEYFDNLYQDFIAQYPSYKTTQHLDELRTIEYARLDRNRQVYLDYTGGGLYAQSQLDQHFQMLQQGVWGNPHSHNPTSLAMTEQVDHTRAYVLEYFNADPAEYDVIFTANASAALKLVGESFPFREGSHFLALGDNHNSINGIRIYARKSGADVSYVHTVLPDLRIPSNILTAALHKIDRTVPNLFAFPGQSNFTGVKHDLQWIIEAQAQGWRVLLDGAAFVPTNRLDLSQHHPDFVSMSFYKIFGYPTGIGCLIAKHEALAELERPWFAGGTITVASTKELDWYYMIDGHPAFEDGTVNYLSIPAVEIGLRYIESVGIEHIGTRVACLTDWLLTHMLSLRHRNGASMVTVHGPQNNEQRGGTITFNLDDPDGQRLDYRRIEQLANDVNISLRTGCFCNPGSGEAAHELTHDEMKGAFNRESSISFDELYELAGMHYAKHPSAVRISSGIASNFNDVVAFMAFLESLLDKAADDINTLSIRERKAVDTA